MKTLYLDCSMGAAGDMLAAALYELLDEEDKKSFIEQMNSLKIPGVVISTHDSVKCGIKGTHFRVSVNGTQENSHDHDHEHHHEHSHNSMDNINHIIASFPLSAQVRNNITAVYKLIADAESHVHGVPVKDIHFHEVGTMDAVADITAVCLLVEKLKVQKIIASSVHVGRGHVHCAHGILPVPAPATAHILRDVPIYDGNIDGELCTPTGAALLKHFVCNFGKMPVMKTEKIGYGMGKKDFPMANCVRAMFGVDVGNGDEISEFICNVDDMTPEKIGFATEHLLNAGALEVYTVPIGMKKSRPGIMLCVICTESVKEKIIQLIFKHTSTLGIRENISRRYTLERDIKTEETSLGNVRVKYSSGYGVTKKKYEYEDIAKIAVENGLSLEDVENIINALNK